MDDEDLRFLHLRPMGSSQNGLWTGRVRTGYGQYFMGTAPLYLLASAVFRLFKHPVLYGSVAMLWGYFSSAVRRVPRYEDPEFRRFLRRYQCACLLRGKARGDAEAERGAGAASGASAHVRSGPASVERVGRRTIASSCSAARSTALTMQAALRAVPRVVPPADERRTPSSP